MSDLELLIRYELHAALPNPSGDQADWTDVLTRSGVAAAPPPVNARATRPYLPIAFACALVAAAAVAVATPVGSAIARGFDGFSAWITGEPGTPASQSEQQAFQKENVRSWSSFPAGTKLRRLIESKTGDTTFTLFGFRSGDTLCLRLVASGEAANTTTDCAPIADLQQSPKPALVIAADEPFGQANLPPSDEGYTPPLASATFGIVSDGVSQIVVHDDDATRNALIGANAFLAISDHPRPGERVREVEAVAGDSTKVTLPFTSAPFGTTDLAPPPTVAATGPTQVERKVDGGRIGWVERHEERGEPLPEQIASSLGSRGPLLFGRVVQPDPQSSGRIVIAELSRLNGPSGTTEAAGHALCVGSLQTQSFAVGCSLVAQLFAQSPMTFGMGGSGSSQFTRIDGLASDDVARMRIFLASGQTRDVPLSDNAYQIDVNRASFPIRVVAYDSDGRIIHIQTVKDDGMTNPAPKAARSSMRELFSVTARDGTKAVVVAGDPAGGYRCWTIRYGVHGASAGGCSPWPITTKATLGNPLNLIGLSRSGDAAFLGGQIPREIASVSVTLPGGSRQQVETHDGFAVYPVELSLVTQQGIVLTLHGYDKSGQEVATRSLRISG